jgi:hypothetical protein
MRRLQLASLIFLVACKPEHLRLADELDRSASWLAAVAEVANTTAANRTPARYAVDVIADASNELEKSAQSLQNIRIAPGISAEGLRLIEAAWPRLARMRSVRADTLTSLQADLDWIEAVSDSLEDLGKRARKPAP